MNKGFLWEPTAIVTARCRTNNDQKFTSKANAQRVTPDEDAATQYTAVITTLSRTNNGRSKLMDEIHERKYEALRTRNITQETHVTRGH